MDDTTVPTTQQPHQQQIRLIPVVTTRIPAEGIEIVTATPETEVPETWSGTYYQIRMHQDGSFCGSNCKCVQDLTHIGLGETLWRGDWTWYGGKCHLVGWLRTGPSETEQRLQGRIEILEEDLDQEAGHRHLAEEDLAALAGRTERLRGSLRRLRKDHRDLDRLATRLLWMAVAGWTVAIALVLIEVSR